MVATFLLGACDDGLSLASTVATYDNIAIRAACGAAVSAQTEVAESDIKATMTTPEVEGALTSVSALGAVAPWNCRADFAGVVTGVEFSREG